jgi:GT2 family glycosyltransferase
MLQNSRMLIEIVSATRLSQPQFWAQSALGQSLRRMTFDKRLVASVAFNNTQGLPEIYNRRISAQSKTDALVFVHDDVWLEDYFFAERVIEGLSQFDVIGVAGNKRVLDAQPAWCFVNDALTWDDMANLSGRVAHGKMPFSDVHAFGAMPVRCELLDGVLIAAKKSALNTANVLFDQQFKFHFYDMDFCRSARAAALSLATWPIAITHQSGGAFGTPAWNEALVVYRNKWATSGGEQQ